MSATGGIASSEQIETLANRPPPMGNQRDDHPVRDPDPRGSH